MMSDGGTVYINDEENHVSLHRTLDSENCERSILTEQRCGYWGWAVERGLSRFDGLYQLDRCPNHACHSSRRDS